MLQMSAPVADGNSGGPLLDQSGNLVGVVTSKLGLKIATKTGDLTQNVNFAIKASLVAAFLETRRVTYKPASSGSSPMTTPDLADYVKSLAVSISCDSTPRDVAGRQTALPDPTVPPVSPPAPAPPPPPPSPSPPELVLPAPQVPTFVTPEQMMRFVVGGENSIDRAMEFSSWSWNEKVRYIRAVGGEYSKVCFPGGDCIHQTEVLTKNRKYAYAVRSNPHRGEKSFCLTSFEQGRKACYAEGSSDVLFLLHTSKGRWRKVPTSDAIPMIN